MKIIKLNAIDSTNSYLKELAKNTAIENCTVVITNEQTSGKGQREAKWVSEKGKNLTFSVYYEFKNTKIEHQHYLNFAISLAIFSAIDELKLSKLNIKWPNDILSANKKLCGILIENSIQKQQLKSSIIGIGINVNQTNFPADLSRATSIKNCINKETDLDIFLKKVLAKISFYVDLFQQKEFKKLENEYLSHLYKKNIPATFLDADKKYFMGIIKGISKNGKLQVLLENDEIQEFGIKEISFV